jgi:hypothetical protein
MAVAKKARTEKQNKINDASVSTKGKSSKKSLSRKEKLALIRKANQLLESVWDKIYDSHNEKFDAKTDI